MHITPKNGFSAATLDQQLRFIDLAFGTGREAREQLVAEGVIPAAKPCGWDLSYDPAVRENSEKIGKRRRVLLARALYDEGLPVGMARDPDVEAIYYEIAASEQPKAGRTAYGMAGVA